MDTESLTAEDRRRRWLFALPKPWYRTRRHKFLKEHDRWRKVAELMRLSRAARGRLEWIIFWEKNQRDVKGDITTRQKSVIDSITCTQRLLVLISVCLLPPTDQE